MAATSTPRQVAAQIYTQARNAGLPPNRALELVAVAQAESSLDPNATNKQSGAAGPFQLLSSGYRQRAQQLGGLYNVNANTGAILPDYASYWKQHPNALPGEAGRDVERSGEGAGFYAKPLPSVRGLVGGVGAAVPAGPQPLAPAAPAVTGRAPIPRSFGQATPPAGQPPLSLDSLVKALAQAAPRPDTGVGNLSPLVAALARPRQPVAALPAAATAPLPARALPPAPASQAGSLPLPQPRTVTSPPQPFLGSVAVHGDQPRPTRLILHDTENPADTPQSVTAGWKSNGFGSQFFVDALGKVAEFAQPTQTTWHTGGANSGSIGLEQAGKASWTRAQWLAHPQELDATARWLASESVKYGIPLVLNTNRGVSTHAMQSRLHPESQGHSDPGPNYPLDLVLARARAYANGLRSA